MANKLTLEFQKDLSSSLSKFVLKLGLDIETEHEK